jgi:LmbE family N-acetylglucosaminyl deacetylase
VEIRTREWTKAAQILGVPRKLLGLKNREVQHSIEARHKVAAVIREHQASIVFLPYFEDAHPDHIATTRIVEDARFDAKLTKTDIPGSPIYPKWMIYYYCTHLRHVANPSFCLDISAQIDIKERAILAYESQFVLPEKNRKVVEWLRQMNGYMGSRIGTAYAEPFYLREPLGLGSLDGVVL